jgi:hypothetical protein
VILAERPSLLATLERAALTFGRRAALNLEGLHGPTVARNERPSLILHRTFQVLGMEDQSAKRNPDLPYPGAFMGAGNQQIHLMELPIIDPVEGRPEHGGRSAPTTRLLLLEPPDCFRTRVANSQVCKLAGGIDRCQEQAGWGVASATASEWARAWWWQGPARGRDHQVPGAPDGEPREARR